MLPLKKNKSVSPEVIAELLKTHYTTLMQAFYEAQSSFMCGVYKRYGSMETANIILCFARNIHLEIIRQREKDLNFNVSLESFLKNYNIVNKPLEKISSISNTTGIPKETVRRKIKNLINEGLLLTGKKGSGYYWNFNSKEKDGFNNFIQKETENLSKFITKIVRSLDLVNDNDSCCCLVSEEIRSQFSFYWYHYLSCQIEWLKYWQVKLKDNDLLLIALQATIPTLHFIDKKTKRVNLDNVFKLIGQVKKEKFTDCSISATSISEITGIPRATSIRKLNILVNLGFLIRQNENKRYSVNQSYESRTKNIMSKDNVSFTVKTFSEYISVILNSLIHNRLQTKN